jgi:hypothetical protein
MSITAAPETPAGRGPGWSETTHGLPSGPKEGPSTSTRRQPPPSACLEERPKARLAEWPYRYGRFILLRVMRRTQSSAAAIWAGVACGLVIGVYAPSGHSARHSQRFLVCTL